MADDSDSTDGASRGAPDAGTDVVFVDTHAITGKPGPTASKNRPLVRPDAVDVGGTVSGGTTPFRSVAGMEESDGVDVAVIVLIKICKLNGRVGVEDIEGVFERLVGFRG